jgi:hypothetical protein
MVQLAGPSVLSANHVTVGPRFNLNDLDADLAPFVEV